MLNRYSMKMRTVLLLARALVLVGIGSLPVLIHRSIRSRIGPEHVFTLPQSPGTLSEEFAVAKAHE
jgi:hypothetical protein